MKLKTKKIALFLILTCFTLTIFGCSNSKTTTGTKTKKELLVYCAAGLKKPMIKIANNYEKEKGVKISYTFANTGQLISQMSISHKGDACLMASDEDYKLAKEKGLIGERTDLTYHIPVIITQKDNPKKINSIKGFSNPGIKVIIGDEKSSPLGKLSSKMFKKEKLYDSIKKNIVTEAAMVDQLIVNVASGKADTSIVWEDNVIANDKVKIIEIPKDKNSIKVVSLSPTKFTKNESDTNDFIKYVSSDKCSSIFEKCGLKVVNK